MIAKRVIPCLDVHAGHVTRGVQFGKAEAGELRNVGDPVTWRASINSRGYGNYPDKESAMAHLEMEIRSGVKMLLEDWNKT